MRSKGVEWLPDHEREVQPRRQDDPAVAGGASASPSKLTRPNVRSVLSLQRRAGNAAVARLLDDKEAPRSAPEPAPATTLTVERSGVRGWVQRAATTGWSRLRSGLTIQRCARAPSREEMMRQVVLTDNDQYVADVFELFYPGMAPAPSSITPQLQELAARMLWAAIQASRTMDFVPRPPSRPTPTWLLKEAVQAAFRYSQDRGIYHAVAVTVARNFRSEYELTRQGVTF